VLGRDLDDAEAWVRSWAAQASARSEAAAQMANEVAALSSTAEDSGGAITVAVDASGLITRLELTDSVRGLRGAELAAEIMRTVRRAQAGLTARVATVVAATVGSDTETGSAVIGSFERRFPQPMDGDGLDGDGLDGDGRARRG